MDRTSQGGRISPAGRDSPAGHASPVSFVSQVARVARADVRQRLRTRRLVVILAVVAFLGYLVNVGEVELAYQIEDGDAITNVHGANTAPFVGLKAGMTGSTIVLLAGFYLMKGALGRERRHRVDGLVASSPIAARTYLLGKWLSNVALGGVILATLAVATVVNFAVHGVGGIDLLALVGPVALFGLPVCAVVAAVAVCFESVDRLDGTLGNVSYFFLATLTLGAWAGLAGTTLSGGPPALVRATDPLGHLAVYELTADAVASQVPAFQGTLPSFGLLRGDETFAYEGGTWPPWIFLQRTALVLPAFAVLALATLPFDQFRETAETPAPDSPSRFAGLVPSFSIGLGPSLPTNLPSSLPIGIPSVRGGDGGPVEATGDPPAVESLSLTRVESRAAGGFGRLLAAEWRRAVRGRRWWWYAGAVAVAVLPVAVVLGAGPGALTTDVLRAGVVPLALIWPLFVWSDLGVRTAEHRVTDLVLSSRYPLRQLLAEWLAGVLVGAAVAMGAVLGLGLAGEMGAALGLLAGVLFAPSLAIAAGMWTRSSTLFEIAYLLVWYAGPLNGAPPVDFAGVTDASVALGVPAIFAGFGLALLGAALLRRRLEIE